MKGGDRDDVLKENEYLKYKLDQAKERIRQLEQNKGAASGVAATNDDSSNFDGPGSFKDIYDKLNPCFLQRMQMLRLMQNFDYYGGKFIENNEGFQA